MKSIIFDMDGVLVDSEPVILAAAMAGLKEYGVISKPEDFKPFIGMGEDRFIGGVAEKYGVTYKIEMKHRVYEIYLEIVDQNLGLYEGTANFLAQLGNKGIKLALASSADRVKIEANLRVAGIDPALFSAVISGEDVVRKKPFPDIFLYAASKIPDAPENCIVVEDAVNGIRAAHAAGMKCIAVASTFPLELLKAENPENVCSKTTDILKLLDDLV